MAAAAVLLVAMTSCGGDAEPESTRLPLQEQGLAVGGDIQSQATDVVETQITEEQATQIAEACNEAVEIAGTGEDDCLDIMQLVFDGAGAVCMHLDLCLRVYDIDEISGFNGSGIIELVDARNTESLCTEESRQVCLRVGIESPELLDQIMGVTPTETTPTETTTTETTPTETTPTGTTPTETTPTQTMPTESPSGDPSSALPALSNHPGPALTTGR
jgi:cell division septation protein DedD